MTDSPTFAEIAYCAAQSRIYRALALENGLDPDNTLPEDILLLSKDKDTKELLVLKELEEAYNGLIYEHRISKTA